MILRVLNALGALTAAGFAVLALVDPAVNTAGVVVTDGVRFYTELYAARQLAVSVVVVGSVLRPARLLAPLLLVAGLSQAVDIAIGISWHRPSLIAGAAALAVVHLGSALWLSRRPALALGTA